MKASDYKKLASAKRTEMVTFDVTLPSGCVWKLREPPIKQYVLAGKLPAAFAGKMASLAKKTGADATAARQAMADSLSPQDLMDSLEFGRDLLLFCAVEPQIALKPISDNQIAPEDILPEDFDFLINWVLSGGTSGESLGTFPEESE